MSDHFCDFPFSNRSRLVGALRLAAYQLVVVASLLACVAASGADSSERAASCLRCHAMETIAYRDPETWEIVDLSVHPARFAQSVHGELECTECHSRWLRRYPHPELPERESLSCVGCHEDDPLDSTYHFKAVEAEYRRSVHVAPGAEHADRFSCHSCHDPHRFRVSRVGQGLAQIVRDGNGVCLSCHEEVDDPLMKTHAWLPKPERHWAAVRCVECHTPASTEPSRVSHEILPAADANRECVQCHSKDARLLQRLYAYRSEEDLERQGLLAKALFNEAYIVGMSRNPTLDLISLVILALTVLGLGLHGYGRYRAHRRREDRT